MSLRLPISLALAVALAALAAGSAFAHAHVLPEQVLADTQYFTLAVANEKDDATTTKVVLTVPEEFSIRQIEPSAGWTQEVTREGSGEDARVSRVTWTADGDAGADGALLHFTGAAESAGDYAFEVEQSYSDGSVVDWAGDEDSDEPAAFVEVKDSLGGGGTSTLAIVALVVGVLGLVLGGAALASGRGRQLA